MNILLVGLLAGVLLGPLGIERVLNLPRHYQLHFSVVVDDLMVNGNATEVLCDCIFLLLHLLGVLLKPLPVQILSGLLAVAQRYFRRPLCVLHRGSGNALLRLQLILARYRFVPHLLFHLFIVSELVFEFQFDFLCVRGEIWLFCDCLLRLISAVVFHAGRLHLVHLVFEELAQRGVEIGARCRETQSQARVSSILVPCQLMFFGKLSNILALGRPRNCGGNFRFGR